MKQTKKIELHTAKDSNIKAALTYVKQKEGYILVEHDSIYKLHLQVNSTYECKQLNTGVKWCGVRFVDELAKLQLKYDTFEKHGVIYKIVATGMIKEVSLLNGRNVCYYASKFTVKDVILTPFALNREYAKSHPGKKFCTNYGSSTLLTSWWLTDMLGFLHKTTITYNGNVMPVKQQVSVKNEDNEICMIDMCSFTSVPNASFTMRFEDVPGIVNAHTVTLNYDHNLLKSKVTIVDDKITTVFFDYNNKGLLSSIYAFKDDELKSLDWQLSIEWQLYNNEYIIESINDSRLAVHQGYDKTCIRGNVVIHNTNSIGRDVIAKQFCNGWSLTKVFVKKSAQKQKHHSMKYNTTNNTTTNKHK